MVSQSDCAKGESCIARSIIGGAVASQRWGSSAGLEIVFKFRLPLQRVTVLLQILQHTVPLPGIAAPGSCIEALCKAQLPGVLPIEKESGELLGVRFFAMLSLLV